MNPWLKRERARRKLMVCGDYVVYDPYGGKSRSKRAERDFIKLCGGLGPFEIMSDMLWTDAFNGLWCFIIATDNGEQLVPAYVLIKARDQKTVA